MNSKKTFHFLNKVTAVSLLLLIFYGCSTEPTVSRYMTVEEFNAANEISASILEDMGYENKSYWASEYYEYVLFDGNKKCTERGDFCTCSDHTDHISPNDRCVKCGKTWKEHEEY